MSPDTLADGQITYEKLAKGVAAIGIDRVAKRNSFTPAMLDQLAARYTQAEDDPDVTVMLLFGRGAASPAVWT
jgi:enoyl-CoA hydratase/carnithine racemase